MIEGVRKRREEERNRRKEERERREGEGREKERQMFAYSWWRMLTCRINILYNDRTLLQIYDTLTFGREVWQRGLGPVPSPGKNVSEEGSELNSAVYGTGFSHNDFLA